jgi:glucokinase
MTDGVVLTGARLMCDGFDGVDGWVAVRGQRISAVGEHSPPSSGPDERMADTAAVSAAAERGDRVAQQVLGELLEHVPMMIIDVTAVLDPERVVLDGSIGRALEPYLPRLVVSTLAPTAVLAGAVAEAWHLRSAETGAALDA